jgi:acyl transferase domain-containing protein
MFSFLPLSAKTIESLLDLASAYSVFINNSKENLEDICAMAALKRSTFEVRKVFVARDKEQLIEQLNDFSELSVEESKNYDADDTVKVVFVCPGQGAQWIGMAQQLYELNQLSKNLWTNVLKLIAKLSLGI